jgi:hypothetical protein
MKPSALRIERMLEKIEAKLVPPERKWLSIIVHEGDAEAVVKEKQEKALAEHVAAHPEDASSTVKDFRWFVWRIVRVKWRADGTRVMMGDPDCDYPDGGVTDGNRGDDDLDEPPPDDDLDPPIEQQSLPAAFPPAEAVEAVQAPSPEEISVPGSKPAVHSRPMQPMQIRRGNRSWLAD